MRTRLDDLAELTQAAIEALTRALNDGDAKHPPGSWAEESTGHQYNHLTAHLRKLQNGADSGEDDLAHLICRAVIIRALQRRGRQ